MKRSEDLVVLIRRKKDWDGPILGIAVVPEALDAEDRSYETQHHPFRPDEVVQRWPVTFTGTRKELDHWLRCELGYHGIPNG